MISTFEIVWLFFVWYVLAPVLLIAAAMIVYILTMFIVAYIKYRRNKQL